MVISASPRARRSERGLCSACVRELFDRTGRRYLYPLVCCDDCRPPMAATPSAVLCEDCGRESREPDVRRSASVATGCAACGPALRWEAATGADALAAAVAAIGAGGVAGVRDLFADQVVCDARSEQALARMDGASGPVRVLVRNVSTAREVANLSAPDIRALVERAEPATLVRLREPMLPRAVRRATPDVDLFLPRTPLQYLLTASLDGPLAVWDRSSDRADGWPCDGTLTVSGLARAGRQSRTTGLPARLTLGATSSPFVRREPAASPEPSPVSAP
ncbi:Sua5/YciO/YrdC/YwlC family protein [Microbispora bryophytorum]|uniref:Sua5/YciO/YrdC/YwlC family protein n=1 Tax=Microbispora bryophytorum TaxID=1460882 RepID=UPI001CC2C208|nr:Sua5/YciO/YrdC/YwlC family protein [Microbispora camponoti]